MALTGRQKAFIDEYLIDLNGAQAAIRAGYAEKSARRMACDNMKNPEVVEAIAKGQDERSKRTKIDADWVLKQLKKQYEKADDGDEIHVALTALEKIGKHNKIQAFIDRISHEVNAPSIVINRPSGD